MGFDRLFNIFFSLQKYVTPSQDSVTSSSHEEVPVPVEFCTLLRLGEFSITEVYNISDNFIVLQ